MALENGMDVKTLSAMLGHVSAAATLDIYTHITDDMWGSPPSPTLTAASAKQVHYIWIYSFLILWYGKGENCVS